MFHLIIGGSGSGKSAYAESCVLDFGPARRIYIATMYPFDQESRNRIARHRRLRAAKQFTTRECYLDLAHLELPEDSVVLLECMSNLTANEMYQEQGSGETCVETILEGIRHLLDTCRHVVVVSNEIFSDGITYDPETEKYMRYLGEINRRMAELADEVTEVVYGIPVHVKGGETT